MSNFKCIWCLKPNVKPSEWEQQRLRDDSWARLCKRCANRRLNNPLNALLPMRKATDPVEQDTDSTNDKPKSELVKTPSNNKKESAWAN